MKKLLVIAVLFLAACQPAVQQGENTRQIQTRQLGECITVNTYSSICKFEFPGGPTCMVLVEYDFGAIDCDWRN